jgi:hypothetical protein
VMIHGLGQIATNWIGTPDGRPGWAGYFLSQRYTVYWVDQPARGRSPWQPTLNGPVRVVSAPDISRRFTASEVNGNWPQGKKHTQWPGESAKKGQMGEPMFDAFYATQVASLGSAVETQTLIQAAAGRKP